MAGMGPPHGLLVFDPFELTTFCTHSPLFPAHLLAETRAEGNRLSDVSERDRDIQKTWRYLIAAVPHNDPQYEGGNVWWRKHRMDTLEELKQVEPMLIEQSLLPAVLSALDEGLFVVDNCGIVVFCNAQLECLIHVRGDQIIGQVYAVLFQYIARLSGYAARSKGN
jgi:PAS domain-containing protein